MSDSFDSALYGVCEPIKSVLKSVRETDKKNIFEIRMRKDSALMVTTPIGSKYVDPQGNLSFSPLEKITVTESDIKKSFELICDYSLQTHENELRCGYISMHGGHRAGISGEGVMTDGSVTAFRKITGISIRISRTVANISGTLINSLRREFSDIPGIVIFGPPGSGKTTLLRDLALGLSRTNRVVLIDEKKELINGHDLCMDFDVLSGIDKCIAAEMAVRNLNPEIILFDEIGSKQQARQIENCYSCGVRVITTLHAGSIDELMRRKIAQSMMRLGAVKAAVFLPAVGAEPVIYNLEEFHENTGSCSDIYNCGAVGYAAKSLS